MAGTGRAVEPKSWLAKAAVPLYPKHMKAALLALAALAAQSTPSQTSPQEEGANIVVTGHSLRDTEKALKDCIARQCPPDQEIDAALAHAENQFVAGDYHGARSTLTSSAGRNRRYAKQYPLPVSDLLRANARIAAHLGEGEAYRIGTIDSMQALKAGLGEDDPRVLAAKVEIGDSLMTFRRIDYARQIYSEVIHDAGRLKQYRVQGFAMLHLASMFTQLAETDSNWLGSARNALDKLIASQVPEHRPFVMAARMLKARLDARRGDTKALDALIAEMHAAPSEKPLLLYAPPIKTGLSPVTDQTGGSTTQRMQMASVEDQWADIGFWVSPDGTPTDVDILRTSPGNQPGWLKPVIEAIKGRRYAPLKREKGDPGILRVERYTLTARWSSNETGTHMRTRSPEARIEMLDLSTD